MHYTVNGLKCTQACHLHNRSKFRNEIYDSEETDNDNDEEKTYVA